MHSKISAISQNIKAWISFVSKMPVMKKTVTEAVAYLLGKKRFIFGNTISSQLKVNDFRSGRVKRPKRKTLLTDLLLNRYFLLHSFLYNLKFLKMLKSYHIL